MMTVVLQHMSKICITITLYEITAVQSNRSLTFYYRSFGGANQITAGYNDKVLEAQSAKAPRLAAYKRARRNRGLERVESLMQSRFDCVLLTAEGKASFAETPKQYNAFRSKACQDCDQIPADQTNLGDKMFRHISCLFPDQPSSI